MKASSESGLCALTISWGATGVIRGTFSLHYEGLETADGGDGKARNPKEKRERAAIRLGRELGSNVGDHPVSAYDALPCIFGRSVNPTVQCFLTTCSLPADEAALIVVRLYMSPPAVLYRSKTGSDG